MADSARGYVFIDIFSARLRIFDDTRLRECLLGWWREWINGHGAAIHAEYTLSQVDHFGEFTFKWDKVNLSYVSSQYDNNLSSVLSTFSLMNNRFKFEIKRRKNMDTNGAYFSLSKSDTLIGIEIILMFTIAPPISPSMDCFDWKDITYVLYVKTEDNCTKFSIRREGGDTRISLLTTGFYPLSIAEWPHNIFEIIEFMKSSRLNVSDYLPRYGGDM